MSTGNLDVWGVGVALVLRIGSMTMGAVALWVQYVPSCYSKESYSDN